MRTELLKLIAWFAESFSGSDKVSGRRLTAFAVTGIYVYASINYSLRVNDPYYLLLGLIVHAAFVLLLFGIITMQQITELKNGPSLRKVEVSTKETSSEIKTETTQA